MRLKIYINTSVVGGCTNAGSEHIAAMNRFNLGRWWQ